MSDNREVARHILLEAGDTILKQRVGVHGSAENSFQMIGDMWSAYLDHVAFIRDGVKVRHNIKPMDVAHMMVQLKQARALYGDPNNRDNPVDAVGYSALAGMLALPADVYDRQQDTEQMKKLETELEIDTNA